MDKKYLIRFSKRGTLRFSGHLDLLRAFGRTARRAGLPAAYSQGFNPHMLLTFAFPLPLGMESASDYAELVLIEEIEPAQLAARLNENAPEGLKIIGAREMPSGETGTASLLCAADYSYRFEPDENIGKVLNDILSSASLVVPKKTKSGIKDEDIRRDIFSLECNYNDETEIEMRIAAGSVRFLHPRVVLGLICERLGVPAPNHLAGIVRRELYKNEDGKFVPLFNS